MATATATATTTTATTTAAYVRPRQNLVPKNEYASRFSRFIKSKPGLEGFYNDKALDGKVEKAKEMGDKLMEQGCGGEFAVPLSLLTLYDIVMLIDDSHSMDYAQDGARKATLKKTIDEITKVYDLANDTGILSVRFINNKQGKKEVSNKKVESLFHERIYEGSTKIGTALEKKVLKPFVLSKEKMEKPLLVMTITDGTIEGEKIGKLKRVITQCIEAMKSNTGHGDGSVAFHFSRVGDDEGAMEMLTHLDNCDEVGAYVDCLPVDAPLESLEEDSLKWRILVKLLIGALDPNIDEDESLLGDLAEDRDIEPFVMGGPKEKPEETFEDED